MSKKKIIIAVLVAIVAIALGWYFLYFTKTPAEMYIPWYILLIEDYQISYDLLLNYYMQIVM